MIIKIDNTINIYFLLEFGTSLKMHNGLRIVPLAFSVTNNLLVF